MISAPLKTDAEMIRVFIRAIVQPNSIFEIRALRVKTKYGKPAQHSGYFTDDAVDGAVHSIIALDNSGMPGGIYMTINPPMDAVGARRLGRIERADTGETTSDKEIACRTTLLIDCDPDRPAGISSTDEEHEMALERTQKIQGDLSTAGWPEPIAVDSGNGGQLWYRIDLPTDDGELVTRCLKALGERYDGEGVHVDQSVFNPARIGRLPGTVNRKGDNTPTRPHRLAVVRSMPSTLDAVPTALLEALGGTGGKNVGTDAKAKKSPAQPAGNSTKTARVNLFGWTRERFDNVIMVHLLDFEPAEAEDYKGGIRVKLKTCPFDASHVDSAALFFSDDKGAAFHCLHNSCKEHKWRDLLEQIGVDAEPQFSSKNYFENAQAFMEEKYPTGLIHHDAGFRRHVGTHYAPTDEGAARAALWRWLAEQEIQLEDGSTMTFRPNSSCVSNSLDALKAVSNVPAELRPPCWLPGHAGPCAAELLAFHNGLMHLPTGELRDHTTGMFNTFSLPFNYEQEARAPHWGEFLQALWPDDPESIFTLKLIFGYLLGGGTYLQKIFMLVGPKRSGKGTIARVLAELLGPDAVCGPTLAGLAGPFGLQTLLDKRLATISDARLSSRVDQSAIAERLLAVSGEDMVSVPRKYAQDWNGKLPTRFLILTNELPRLADSSGALASRFIVLAMNRSFYGKEDHGLTARLMTELPGIANWAIDGWRELQRVGRIEMPASSRESTDELYDLGSPVAAFVRDRCTVGSGRSADRRSIYSAWCAWCESEGREHPGTAESFGRDLRAVVPTLRTTQHRTLTGDRVRNYEGISLGVDWYKQAQADTGGGTGGEDTEPVAIHVVSGLAQDGTGKTQPFYKKSNSGEEKSWNNNRKSPVPPCATCASTTFEKGEMFEDGEI